MHRELREQRERQDLVESPVTFVGQELRLGSGRGGAGSGRGTGGERAGREVRGSVGVKAKLYAIAQ